MIRKIVILKCTACDAVKPVVVAEKADASVGPCTCGSIQWAACKPDEYPYAFEAGKVFAALDEMRIARRSILTPTIVQRSVQKRLDDWTHDNDRPKLSCTVGYRHAEKTFDIEIRR